MQSVTSNAVYNAIDSQKIMVRDTKIGNFTLNAGQTVSPNITSYVHTPPQGYSRLCSLYSNGQNFFQLSMNFVNGVAYATITNTYTGPLTTDIYLYEIFMPINLLPT